MSVGRSVLVLMAIAAASCGDDTADVVTDCAGGPAGGEPMTVVAAADVGEDDCDGGFAVRGHGFVDANHLRLCAGVDADPARCVEPAITARTTSGTRGQDVPDGSLVDVSLVHLDGALVATDVRPAAAEAPDGGA